MAFCVKDLMGLEVMQGAVLLAGEKGLHNEIEFANVMETPEVAKFMKGGEFLITAGFAFDKDPVKQRELIRELAHKKVAAFGINLGRYFDKIPEEMVDEANKRSLPLIQLPKNLAYMEIMIPVWQQTVSDRLSISKSSEKFYNVLLDVVFSQRGTAGICHTLSQLINNPALLLDNNCNAISTSLPSLVAEITEGVTTEALIKKIKELRSLGTLPFQEHLQKLNLWFDAENSKENLKENPKNDLSQMPPQNPTGKKISVVIMPILVNNNLNGFLVIPEVKGILDKKDETALEDTGTIIALEIFKDKAVFTSQRQVEGEFLDDLISGYYRDEEAVLRRAGYLNFNLVGDMVMVFITIPVLQESHKTPEQSPKTREYDVKTMLMEAVYECASKEFGGVLISSRSDCLICLINLKEENTLDDINKLFVYINKKSNLKETIYLGCSNIFCGINKIKKAYTEAKLAVKNKFFFRNDSGVSYYNRLGVFLLLNEIKELPAAEGFSEQYLSALIEYDKKNGGELLKTLEAYFQNNGNLRLTADALYVHKNSVIYRLNKIQQLTGLSLDNPDSKFILQMGLYLLKLNF